MLRFMSVLLVIAGLTVMGFAITMDVGVDLPGASRERVFNLHKASQQSNFLIVGGILFIAGIILVVASSRKRTSALTQSGSHSFAVEGRHSKLVTRWKEATLSRKAEIVAVALYFVSLPLAWRNVSISSNDLGTFMSYGEGIGAVGFACLSLTWVYPILMTFGSRALPTKWGAISLLASMAWIGKEGYDIAKTGSILRPLGENGDAIFTVTPGFGLYCALVAALLFLVGIATSKKTV